MTGTNDKIRSLFLTAVMVLSVFAMSYAFTGTVAAQDRTIGAGNQVPIVVFPEEEVDITNAQLRGGGTIGAGTTTLTGISGEADGELLQDDAGDFDFSGAAPGGYNATGGDRADIIVRQPSVDSVSLFRGAATTNPDSEITGQSIPEGTSAITVRASWDFDSQIDPVTGADSAFVVLFDPSGAEISGEVTYSPVSGAGTGLMRGSSIPGGGSPNTVTISNMGSLPTGTYTVAVAGLPDDSYDSNAGVDAPSPFDSDRGAVNTAEFTIGDPGQTISLRETEVTQGTFVTGDVTGGIGTNVTVRVRLGNNRTGTGPNDVFRATSEVLNRNITRNINGVDYFTARLELEDRGSADFQVNTSSFEADTTSTFEVTRGTNQTSVNDSVDLRVNSRDVTITSAPNAIVIGEEFSIEGEAPQSNRVKAWARIGSDYRALNNTAGNFETARVRSDGTFTLDIDSSQVINLPASYRIVVTADETSDVPGLANAGGPGNPMTSTQLNNVNTKETTSIRAVEGQLTARLSSDRIATGDEITMEGEALGQGQSLRLYVVGPRGDVQGATGNSIPTIGGADTVSVTDQQYDVDLTPFSLRGTYQIAIAGPGRNQNFEAPGANFGAQTQSEAMEILQDQYDQPGSDDVLVTTSVQAQNAMLTIDDFRTNGQVEQGTLELSGQSNRQDETLIFIEVIDENDDVVVSSEGEVNGSANSWSGDIDLSDVEPGTYTLRADDDDASAEVEFELVEEVSTPTPTPTETEETPTPTETEETPTPTETEETPTPTETTETTEGQQQPGFGALVALIALIGAALLAVRRNS